MPITLNNSFSDIASAIRELRGTSNTYTPGQMALAIGQYKNSSYSVNPENVRTIRDTYNSIASAIRFCNGSSDTYTPAQMPDAIRALNPLSGLTVNPASVWTSGTDNDVLLMVQLADTGTIDLTNYWSVGNTRSVPLSAIIPSGGSEYQSAQTVEMVLMHANPSKYTYVTTPSSGKTKPFFIYGQKNSLATKGYINSSNKNDGSWNSTSRKTWCDNGYRNAVPAYLKTITKQVSFITGVYSVTNSISGNSNQNCTGYFFLPAEKEVRGSRTLSTSNEADALEQWTWYATSANRIKKRSSSANNWWLRSPTYNNSTKFCGVSSSGSTNQSTASTEHGLAPHGCI